MKRMLSFYGKRKEGLTQSDEMVAQMLYKSKKPVVLAVNKVDNPEMRNDIYDFYSLVSEIRIPFQAHTAWALGIIRCCGGELWRRTEDPYDEYNCLLVDLMCGKI